MFDGFKILVVGDSSIDSFKYVDCYKMSPEAPVLVGKLVKQTINPGMAANVVECLRSLAPNSTIIPFHQDKEILKERILDAKYYQHFIRIDSEDGIERIDLEKFNYIVKNNKIDAVIVSDYNKGFLLKDDIKYILDYCSNNNILSFMDTKKYAGDYADNCFCVKINEKEYSLSPEWNKYCRNLIVTLGANGASYYNRFNDFSQNYGGYKVDVSSIIGCGDTFISSLTLKYLETGNFSDSIDFANYCASISASKNGVYNPTVSDINNYHIINS